MLELLESGRLSFPPAAAREQEALEVGEGRTHVSGGRRVLPIPPLNAGIPPPQPLHRQAWHVTGLSLLLRQWPPMASFPTLAPCCPSPMARDPAKM